MKNKEQKNDDIQTGRRFASENPKGFMDEMGVAIKEINKMKRRLTGWSLLKEATDFHYDPLKWIKSHESKQ